MVIVMKDTATEPMIQSVSDRLEAFGFQVHKVVGVNRTILGAIGDKRSVEPREFEVMEGVHEVLRITEPYKLASRTFHSENTVIDVKGASEIMEINQLEVMLKYVDILQVGARNMQNFPLLRELGTARIPILLKRGLAATIEELLMAAEYIMSGGNYQVIVCERGIRTFESYTRNTMDISAIPVIQKLSHLPIIADPSHGTGRRDKVAPMARAAVAAGANGVIVEVHHDPDHALSDGAQSIFPSQLQRLMEELRMIAWAIGKNI